MQSKKFMSEDLSDLTAVHLAEVILEHHKMSYFGEGDEEEEEDETVTQLVGDVENMKKDVAEMIVSTFQSSFLEKKKSRKLRKKIGLISSEYNERVF